jgi:hypothetical protein
MSMYTARCVVVRCDVAECKELAEVLCRDGAMQSIAGWLEVIAFGGGADTSRRKFICPTHAALLNLGSFETPAEIPLSQAMQDPRFQRPETLTLMAALDPDLGRKLLFKGAREAIDGALTDAAKQLPAAAEGSEPNVS